MQPEHPLSDQVICFSTVFFASMVWSRFALCISKEVIHGNCRRFCGRLH